MLNLIHMEWVPNVKKNRLSGISLLWEVLGLRNETIWPGFLLYLTVP